MRNNDTTSPLIVQTLYKYIDSFLKKSTHYILNIKIVQEKKYSFQVLLLFIRYS